MTTSSVVRLPLVNATPDTRRRLPLLDQYLREQQDLTAVERFARRHDSGGPPAQEPFYRDLIPLSAPKEGQQYAFRVDLDLCTGCKACVTACHNLNGLDDDETWRAVGLLHGGAPEAPVKQTVTTACHHCLDPACSNGCPVGAYEKDPITGIVRHLDDQCIGCQYCTFTCPYEVPQFNAKRGIVRKCDMCSGRLAAGEAPACVQACPNEAISITVVEKRQVLEDAQGDGFLPGAPSPGITAPTTVYTTERALPRNLLPANFYRVTPSEHHTPLVIMLVLTQLSVGAFVVDAGVSRFLPPDAAQTLRPLHSAVAVMLGLAALGASVLHLGRPLYAFRAVLGLRTSWMSREIVAFGAFAPLAILYAASFWQARAAALVGVAPLDGTTAATLQTALSGLVALTGLAGILCSTLIYHVTRRPWWHGSLTGFKFLMTAVVLGLATTLLTFSAGSALFPVGASVPVAAVTGVVARTLVVATALKLAGEAAFFLHLRDKRLSALRRSAVLMKDDLRRHTTWRFLTGIAGGIVLPLLCVREPGGADVWLAALSFVLLAAGELLERTMFFAAASSPGMPGGLR